MLRIIDKKTNVFIRDDFSFDEELEIGLDVEPAQGLYEPKWNGEEWVENLTEQEIQDIIDNQPKPEPSFKDRLDALENLELERIMGDI